MNMSDPGHVWAYEMGKEVGEEVALELLYENDLDLGADNAERPSACRDYATDHYSKLPGWAAIADKLSFLDAWRFWAGGFDEAAKSVISEVYK